jgi:ribosome-associated protein
MVAAVGTVTGVAGDVLRVNRSLTIPLEELDWHFTASGGPGGQHANTANTRVELRFDLDASRVLTAAQRQRLLARFGPVVRVVVSDERSQSRNRDLALTRLADRLAGALQVTRTRRATRPSAAAVERRMAAKRRRSQRKRERSAGRDQAEE